MKNDVNKNILLNNNDFIKEFAIKVSNARETKNITQEQASQLLNISKNIVINLENGELKNLENNVFVLGHIKTYLKWLNIDHKTLFENIESYKPSTNQNKNKKLTFIEVLLFNLSNKYGKNKLLVTIILISIISSSIIIFSWSSINTMKYNHTKNNENIYDVDEKAKTDIENSLINEDDNVINANTNNEIIEEDSINKESDINNSDISYLKVLAKSDSWVEIQDKNSKIVISTILKKNDSLVIDYEKGLKLVTGNAGGINIEINDIVIENIGEDGEVKRDISLNYDSLIKLNE